jgi:hypothetical protein
MTQYIYIYKILDVMGKEDNFSLIASTIVKG